jgi:hypothetical protein
MRVSINILKGNGNAMALCKAMAEGIKVCGDAAVTRDISERDMRGFNAAVLWGFTTPCQQVVRACEEAGIPWVFMDNGYQLRGTHFKVTINSRHPDLYLMSMDRPGTRFKEWGVTIKPWQRSTSTSPIIVAGMSPKAAWSFGFGFEEYERKVISSLQKVTKRPIIYRPKISNSPGAKPIDGTSFSGKEPIASVLAKAHCVVTHHSNVGCDALLAGVPVFTRCGAARSISMGDDKLNLIEEPLYLKTREQWAYNLAYCQWSAPEMVSGACWEYMKVLMHERHEGWQC